MFSTQSTSHTRRPKITNKAKIYIIDRERNTWQQHLVRKKQTNPMLPSSNKGRRIQCRFSGTDILKRFVCQILHANIPVCSYQRMKNIKKTWLQRLGRKIVSHTTLFFISIIRILDSGNRQQQSFFRVLSFQTIKFAKADQQHRTNASF